MVVVVVVVELVVVGVVAVVVGAVDVVLPLLPALSVLARGGVDGGRHVRPTGRLVVAEEIAKSQACDDTNQQMMMPIRTSSRSRIDSCASGAAQVFSSTAVANGADLRIAGASAQVSAQTDADRVQFRCSSRSSSALADMIMPGVQNPHCTPPASNRLRWRACISGPPSPPRSW